MVGLGSFHKVFCGYYLKQNLFTNVPEFYGLRVNNVCGRWSFPVVSFTTGHVTICLKMKFEKFDGWFGSKLAIVEKSANTKIYKQANPAR